MRSLTAVMTAILALGLLTPAAQAKPPLAPVERAEDYCAQYSSGDNVVLLFIDRTDKLLEQDKKDISAAATIALSKLQEGWRMQVFIIGDQYRPKRMIFDNCLPGTSKTVVDTIFSKPPVRGAGFAHEGDLLRADYNRAIEAEKTFDKENPSKSAIVAVLGTVSTALQEKGRKIKDVVIASDLLDNDSLPFPPPAPLLAHEVERYNDDLRKKGLYASLGGARVEVVGFGFYDSSSPAVKGVRQPLPKPINDSLKTFWKSYFERSGAGSAIIP